LYYEGSPNLDAPTMATSPQPRESDTERASTSSHALRQLCIIALTLGSLALLVGYQFFKGQAAYPADDETELIAALEALDRGDFALARPVLRSWAERGDASAQFALARMYANGRGVEQDAKQAERWYRRAGQQGNTRAMVELGRLYASGRDIAKNLPEAVQLFREATTRGDPLGALHLGILHLDGDGVPKNPELAFELIESAAKRGSADAMQRLGFMYQRGLGTLPNIELALDRHRRAAALGAERSITLLEAFGLPPTEDTAWTSSPMPAPGEIPLRYDGQTYYIDVLVAGRETITFKLDSGATGVTVPVQVLHRLRAEGILTDAHFKGEAAFTGWDGRTSYRETLTLPSLRIGNHVVENVDASEARSGDATLLGLGFLRHFRSWSIDNDRRVLFLNERR